MTRGLSLDWVHQTYPAEKKELILKRSNIFEEQPFSQQLFSAALLSSLSQQLFSAASLGSLSQQPSSAIIFSQQFFSAVFVSSSSQQPLSAAFLSSHPQVSSFLSSLSQQFFSAVFLSSSSQQPLSAAILSRHLAMVRGWWSAINIILLWSVVGGQLLTSSCCSQGLVVSYEHVL